MLTKCSRAHPSLISTEEQTITAKEETGILEKSRKITVKSEVRIYRMNMKQRAKLYVLYVPSVVIKKSCILKKRVGLCLFKKLLQTFLLQQCFGGVVLYGAGTRLQTEL